MSSSSSSSSSSSAIITPEQEDFVIRHHVPIAICGYSYRLPGGLETDNAFWDLLASRGYVQESIGDRYGEGVIQRDGFADGPLSFASLYEGLIKDGRELEFDCALFGISAHDAKRMDPQIKMMLMATWEALQCSGMDQAALHNSNTGVFTGIQTSSIAGWRPLYGAKAGDVPGKSGSMIANRISFHFNWMGPSFSVATACSSGITALDAAVKSLDCGECSLAAFGAVHYLGHAQSSIGFNALGIVSKTGTSRSFDKDANGYMRSEGAFVYILKRLVDAERDGDKIFGVIRGCALNTAGAEENAELLTQGRMIVAPVMHAQQKLMEQIVAHVGVDPTTVDYIEAHATGTVLGDAIEGNAIANVYGGAQRETKLRIASVRSNIGHMEAASFTCSLLKIMLMFQRRQFLPISSHHKEATDKIPFEEKNIRVITEVEPFPENKIVRVGVNSFGFGGANGHCLLEEYTMPGREAWSKLPGTFDNKVYMIPLSAKSDEALIENARRLAQSIDEIASKPEVDLHTLVGNLSVRMTHHRVRTALTAASMTEFKEKLIAFTERADIDELKDDEISKVNLPRYNDPKANERGNILFVFPGQGSQWAGCGRELYETELVFRRAIDAIDQQWMKLAGCKLSDIAFDEEIGDKLNECCWAQPVTFMLQVGMFELLCSHGIHPKAVLGHSAGEPSAAYASGAYTLEEACYLVYHRARLQTSLAGCGRMLVLMLDSSAAEDLIHRFGFEGQVEIACLNSVNNTVVCGAEDIILSLQKKLEADGQPGGTLIPGNIAFHSQHMKPIKDTLFEELGVLDGPEPRCSITPMISTVTGNHIRNFDADYWWKNVRQPVDLIAAITTADNNVQPQVIIEISPHITLRSPIRDYYNDANVPMPFYIHTLVRKSNTADLFAQTVGNCFKAGLPVNFAKLYPRPFPITHLFPHYSMKRERVIDDNLDDKALTKKELRNAGPLLGSYTSSDHLSFENVFSKQHFAWMVDHVVQGQPLVPAAAYIEIIFEVFKGKIVHIVTARCLVPFVLTNEPAMIYTDLFPCPYAPHRYEFKIFSRLVGDHTLESKLHCMGVVEILTEKQLDWHLSSEIPRNIKEFDEKRSDSELVYPERSDFYSAMSARIGQNFAYGPYFQGVSKVEYDKKNHRIRYDVTIDHDLWEKWDMMGYMFHPTMLDGALQSFLVYLLDASDFSGVPQMVKNMIFMSKPSSEKIIVVYEPPDYLKKGNFHQKGQLAIALGERSAGHCWIYDGVTGDLMCVLGDYTSYSSNTKISDMRKVKHCLSWQPKDIADVEGLTGAVTSLIGGFELGVATKSLLDKITAKAHPQKDTSFFLNVAECLIGGIPERLVMEDCMSSITNSPVQYSVVCQDSKFLSDSYQKIGVNNADAHLRFASMEEDMSKGFLRPGMCELLVVRLNLESDDSDAESDFEKELEECKKIAILSAPGGIVVVESRGKKEIPMPSDWTCVWKSTLSESSPSFMIYKTPAIAPSKRTTSSAECTNDSEATPLSDSSVSVQPDSANLSVVVNDSLGFADFFRLNVSNSSSTDVNVEQSCDWGRVDYFAMHVDDETIELFDGPSRLTEFVKEMNIRRSGGKNIVPCIFTVYTSGAMMSVTSPSQTGIWGAVRSLALELGDTCSIDFRLIDLATKEDLRFVASSEILRERELCIHNGRLWTCRLINIREPMPMVDVSSDDPDSFRLHTNNSGLLADLEFRLDELPELKPYEIEISVKASALNFRDIMVGLGKLPLLSYEASQLGRTVGMECSGVVLRCGSEVQELKPGDRVLAVDGGCIANRLICHQGAAYKMPNNLTFEQGCALSSVYNTAWYALTYVARVREGQSVLIHSALGGVGLAAIAIAKLYGLKIYGTAGTEEKRQSLREMGCIDAFDSHSTTWLPDLMVSTKGRGVDVVINSLAGDHVDCCLEALTPGGYHCEIGKVDIFQDRPMKLAVFRKNIKFCAIDMDRLMHDDPLLVRKLISEFLVLIEEGKLPSLPCSTYAYKDYHDALRCMMNGQHRGKLVLTPPGPGETISAVDNRKLFGRSKDGSPRTVLMSGCLGGFGLRVLAYVIALGARHVVLMDRDPKRKRTVQWVLENSYVSFLLGKIEGLRVEIVYGDVGIYEHVVDAVASVDRLGLPPIGSVFHLAGILDDKKVEEMDRDSFAKVYQPKANGAWNLHRATSDFQTIDHFVMFSSTSSVFGNPGQVNYSAANSYQDGLAAMRLQNGKPALSFCMGAVIEAGMASRSPQLLQLMKAGGMPAISCLFAIEALDAAIRGRSHWNSVAALAKDLPANFDSPDYLRTVAQLIRNNAAFKMGDSSNLSREALIEILSERVGKLCGVEKLDPTEPFSSYGLNSISVAELAAYLKNEMGYTVSAMELMTSATCESIADGIIQASQASPESVEEKGDEGTAATGADTDSATGSSDEDDGIWTEPVVQHQSLFEPTIQEYFTHPPPRLIKEFVKHDMASLLKVDSGKVEKETNSASDPLDNLGALDDRLPPPCQKALDTLTSFVDSIDVSNVAGSVPIKDIKCALLTGATGFVGRHFIADLLNYSETYIEKIYCPVRANSDEAAMDRLVEAMEEAGTWDDKFASRLRVFRADLKDVSLGVPPELLNEIYQNVDVVYHVAANIALTSNWNESSADNCTPMQAVFKLCLSVRRKHLYYVSTLGIFPQYFCQFSNEMSDKAILRDAMPSVALMKRIFPLAIAGYPWSKLTNEVACLKARRTKGLDVAIFRLPVMSTNSKTGYSVHGDPWVRLFFATLQLRLLPGNGRPRIMEDSALSNEMMLRISLNSKRKNVLYNLSYQSHTFTSDAPINDMMGFPCQTTTYENFKSQCLKLGPDSPVNAYWTLLDTFVSYWVNFKRFADEYPIDISSVEEDCVPLPEKTNSMTVLSRSMEWASKQNPTQHSLNISLLHPSIDLESILVPARKVCSKYGMDFHSVVKPFVIEGLSRVCDEIHTRKSMLPEVAMSLTMRLEARVHLHRLLQLHPEIYEESIQAPLFILGLPGTGTIGLHRLLEASGKFEAPHPEDQFALPTPEQIVHPDEKLAKKRLGAIASYLNSVGTVGDGMQYSQLGSAEEDLIAHSCAFMSLEFDILFDLPRYRAWFESQPLDSVYEEHLTWMQFIAWWRRRQNPFCAFRWCYRLPWHLRSLNQLLSTYPDARLVQVHSDIKDAAGAWCSLVKSQRSRFVENINVNKLGRRELKTLEKTLAAGIEFRMNHPELEGKWMDIHYNQLMRSPLEVAKKVFLHAGIKLDSEALSRMSNFIQQFMAQKEKFIPKQQNYQEYGITSKDLEISVFKHYNSRNPFNQLASKLGQYMSSDHLFAAMVVGAACASLVPVLSKYTS